MDLLAPLLVVTAAARDRILELRAVEPEPDALALWLEVSGVRDAAYTYDMYFQRLDEAAPDDSIQRDSEMSLVVPQASVDKVRGATLDLSGTGMAVRNPNSPSPAVGARHPSAELSGDVAQRVIQVLDEQINPAIAAHGGRAELVAVEDGIAYLRLGGGCQGCGMASVTLSQGIEVAIRDAVPELTGVIDVTDHAGGTNPFFESAKG